MLLKNSVIEKIECYTPEKWYSEKKSIKIENKIISNNNIDWIDIIKRVFNSILIAGNK